MLYNPGAVAYGYLIYNNIYNRGVTEVYLPEGTLRYLSLTTSVPKVRSTGGTVRLRL